MIFGLFLLQGQFRPKADAEAPWLAKGGSNTKVASARTNDSYGSGAAQAAPRMQAKPVVGDSNGGVPWATDVSQKYSHSDPPAVEY